MKDMPIEIILTVFIVAYNLYFSSSEFIVEDTVIVYIKSKRYFYTMIFIFQRWMNDRGGNEPRENDSCYVLFSEDKKSETCHFLFFLLAS
jgi:hypothetical protein